jgi:hypothetical protein
MTNPVDFADRAGQLGVTLPYLVLVAANRARALTLAIEHLASDPIATVDVQALEPEHIARALLRVIHAENRAAVRHSDAVNRLRTTITMEATRQIRDHGDAIIAALRTVHDPLVAQLTADSGTLSVLHGPAALTTAGRAHPRPMGGSAWLVAAPTGRTQVAVHPGRVRLPAELP